MTILIVAVVLFAAPCFGQTPDKGAPELEIHGSIRSRLEIWNWFQGDADNSYAFSGNHLRFSVGQKRAKYDWLIDFAAPVLIGLPDDAAAPAPQGGLGLGVNYYGQNKNSRNAAMVFPKQAYMRFHHLGSSEDHSIRLGRFDYIDGGEVTPKNGTLAVLKKTRVQQRLIGSFGWSHVGRSYNGFHYAYDGDSQNFTLAGAVPSRGVFQVDGWGVVKTGFAYGSWTRPISYDDNAGELRLFGIYYQDWRPIGKTDNRPGPVRGADRGNIRIGTFGGHYLHAADTTAGTADLLVWGVMQTGRWSVQDHSAGAFAVEAGFQPKILGALRPWLRGGYFYSSGDDDPNDNKHDTFFQILPTPRIYSRFPFYNLMNLQDVFGELVLRPHEKVTLRADVHGLRLSERNDLWYAGGGAFNPWAFGYAGRPSLGGRGLATLYDVSIDVAATKNITLSGYYGYANGKSIMAAIYPDGKNAQFGYLEFTYGF